MSGGRRQRQRMMRAIQLAAPAPQQPSWHQEQQTEPWITCEATAARDAHTRAFEVLYASRQLVYEAERRFLALADEKRALAMRQVECIRLMNHEKALYDALLAGQPVMERTYEETSVIWNILAGASEAPHAIDAPTEHGVAT